MLIHHFSLLIIIVLNQKTKMTLMSSASDDPSELPDPTNNFNLVLLIEIALVLPPAGNYSVVIASLLLHHRFLVNLSEKIKENCHQSES